MFIYIVIVFIYTVIRCSYIPKLYLVFVGLLRLYSVLLFSIMALTTRRSAASALDDALKKCVPVIVAIMEACKAKPAGIMQPSVDEIRTLCLENGLAFMRNILGRVCGIHPENRARTGVDPINAQNLALKISKQGYSETKLENPNGL